MGQSDTDMNMWRHLLYPFAVALLVLGACSETQRGTLLTSANVGSGQLEVRCDAAFVFSSQTVRFYFKDENGVRLLATTELANDGAQPGLENVEIVDLGQGVWQVTLNGQEQEPEIWSLHTSSLEMFR